MTVAVLYHQDCPDGWTAAWAARDTLKRGPRQSSPMAGVELVAVSHGSPPPDLADDVDEVYIVDFCYPHDTLVEMAKDRRVVVLDHHRTAIDAIVGANGCVPGEMQDGFPYEAVLDVERSGAGITWDYFHAGKRPPLVDYVEDRDLWRFALPESKAVSAYIVSQPRTLEAWDELAKMPVEEMVVLGRGAAARMDGYCRSVVGQAYPCEMGGRTFPIVNAPHDAGSDVANLLLDVFEADMAGYFFERADGRWQYGFRSRNGVTVHDHAQVFGGGGHPQASGCEVAAISHLRAGTGGQW